MRRSALILLGVLLALGIPLRARADDDAPAAKPTYRIVVDRVEHEPASIGGTRLQITMSALSLQGGQIPLDDPKATKLKTTINGSEIKAPYSLGSFVNTKEALALVVIVQSTVEFTDVMPAIAETLDGTFLAAMEEQTTQVAILPYGDSIGTGKLGSVKSARTKAAALSNDGSTGDPALLETIERALSMLKRAKTEPEGRPLRKVIVVISDGRERSGERTRVTKLGVRAAKEGVRIHSFGYAPTDVRRPLLNLGELSRQSFGTFRWLQRKESGSWAPAFEQLRDEINKQYVLTYYLGADEDPTGKKLKVETVGRVNATSNEMKVPEASCNGEVCAGYCTGTVCAIPAAPTGRGILGWILLIGGIALGAIVVLAIIGTILAKRQAKPRPVPGAVPGVAAQPGAVAAPAVAAPPPVAVNPNGPCLMYLSGPNTGQRMPLHHGFVIGKDPSCHLVIDDGYTSGHHAQIGMDQAMNCSLYDMNSTNGTFVNGVRIQQKGLDHGVTVRIGSTDLRFLAQ